MYTQHTSPSESNFDLRDSLVVLRRRRWTLIIVILVVLALGAFSSYRKTPSYSATATALLKAGAADSVITEQLSSDPERRVSNEAVLIKSARTARAVAERLGFSSSVSVVAGGDDDVLEITATGGDPERVALVANTYAEVHAELRLEDNRHAVRSAIQGVRISLDSLNEAAAVNAQELADLNQDRVVAPDVVTANDLDRRISENQAAGDSIQNNINTTGQQLSQLKSQQGLIDGRPPIEILVPASVPGSPTSPNHRQDITIVLILGILLGIGVVFLQEHLDDTVRDIADVVAATGDLPSLAVIPTYDETAEWTTITATKPMSHAAESYRSLRTSVEFLALEKRMQTIQITSAEAGEGKTTCVVNLAVAFAQAGQKVIVVDCDLRRPRLHQYFGIDRHFGFTSVLLHERKLDEVIRPSPDYPNLHVLCAGPLAPNPSELLGSEGFAEVLRKLTVDYSVVLLDSPPVLPVSDAIVLSRVVDATIMLTNSGTSSKRRVKRAVDSLRQVAAPIVGTVLNSAPHEVAYGYVDYGYVAYGSSSGGPYSSGRRPARTSPRQRAKK